MKNGVFAPPALVGPIPFADLRIMITRAETALEAFTPDEVNGWADKDLDFQIGPRPPCTPLRLYNNRSRRGTVEELVERAERRVTARLPSRALKAYYDGE